MIREEGGSDPSGAARASSSSIVMVVNWTETLKQQR
jgi:hypothetical protein